jgi:hypothetical protein
LKVTPVDLSDLDLSASELVRSPGLHASTIYNDLYKDINPERYTGDQSSLAVYGTLGTAWEERLQYLLIKSGLDVFRPGELRAKGGQWVLSPDGILCNGHDSIVEYKVAWASCSHAPKRRGDVFGPKFGKYMIQLQDGCNSIESSHARIYIYFVNGDYGFLRKGGKGKPPLPQLLAWDIEFSARELKEAFDSMLNHAKHKRML